MKISFAALLGTAAIALSQSNHIDYVQYPAVQQWCSTYSAPCFRSQTYYLEATTEAISRFGSTTLANGRADAFRICLWAAKVSNDVNIRNINHLREADKLITERYIELSDRTAQEKRMDLSNAQSGRAYGRSFSPKDPNIKTLLVNQCAKALNGLAGVTTLVTIA